MKKEWVDMTDQEKKKEDVETYFVEIILDFKRMFGNGAQYKLDELKNYIEREVA